MPAMPHPRAYLKAMPIQAAPHGFAPDLRPRGNIGDTGLPTNRPDTVNVFLHDNTTLTRETDRLSEAYIIDARFVTEHGTRQLHRDLSKALPRQTCYEVSHISSFYYLLMFNSYITDQQFKACFAKKLTPLGYISFLWSLTVKSKEHSLSYKVWLDLVDLPPHIWALDELAILTSSFGLILAHTLLNQLSSFERLRLSIATDNLS
jgi:hypothetical protein